MPLLASSFQQYIIGTQALHIFPSFRELVVIGRNISLGSVLPFSCEPDNMLAAHSSPSSLGCTLRCGVLRMMGKGRFYCICSEVLLLYVFSMFHLLRRKIHGNNCLLNNSPSPIPHFFGGWGKDASNNDHVSQLSFL